MFVDFAVNDNGDLMFSECNKNYSSLNISFSISDTKAQKILFGVEKTEDIQPESDSYLKISFEINKNQQNLSAMVYKDDVALAQLISLQLRESVGELLYRKDEGSKLSLFKHQLIDDNNLRALEIYLENFLKGYLYNPIVKANPVIDYTNGYKQLIDIYIYNNDSLLLQYTIES